MKRILFLVLFVSINLFAQDFTVEKLSGNVQVLKGTSEEFVTVKAGDKLNGNDLLITDEKSFVQLNKSGNMFILQSNSALGLSFVKQISINDLLLALAMEEIRKVPKKDGNGNSKNTAVYGSEIINESSFILNSGNMGIKKINGAKQLAENGYKESAVIVAKETFRKYPATINNIEERIYFADVLVDLNLFSEAYEEFEQIKKTAVNSDFKSKIEQKLESVKKLMKN